MDERELPPEYLDRYSGATSQIPELGPTDVPKTPVAQAVPSSAETTDNPATHVPWYNPRGWGLRTKLGVVAAVVVFIVVVVVGTVEGIRANRYPDYAPLNYRLVDTYQGTSFFDRFDYFSAEDPTDGFVVYAPLPRKSILSCADRIISDMSTRRQLRISISLMQVRTPLSCAWIPSQRMQLAAGTLCASNPRQLTTLDFLCLISSIPHMVVGHGLLSGSRMVTTGPRMGR